MKKTYCKPMELSSNTEILLQKHCTLTKGAYVL